MELQFDKKEIRQLEKLIIKRIEDIIFVERTRPSGRQKVAGGLVIEDDSGALRRKLKSNKNFIKFVSGGFEIDIKMKEYFKYLDDSRRDELNWYLSEAIFEDKEIRDTVKKVTAAATKRTIIKLVSQIS